MPEVKGKERILKASRERQLGTFKGAPVRLSADFSTKTLQARGSWHEIFKVIKSRDLQPILNYPAILSFKNESEINNILDQKKKS